MRKTIFILLVSLIFLLPAFSYYEVPPTYAMIILNLGTINPVGLWKEAFSPAPYFSLSIQYPAKVMNLYIGGKIDFTTMNGKEYRDVFFQLFSIYGYVSYNLIELEDLILYINGGLGINFEEIQFGDGTDEAILGGFKFDIGARKRAGKNLFLNLNLNYTY
ncbi:MAG TPA: hypothetical protein ENN73_00610, partial [Firmicutes bacterium]|nr:hypothetical protein [Bacillota bacterium]